MNENENIIEVNEADFNDQVIEASLNKAPKVVEAKVQRRDKRSLEIL